MYIGAGETRLLNRLHSLHTVLGYKRNGGDNFSIAVIGDGGLTAGMAFEARQTLMPDHKVEPQDSESPYEITKEKVQDGTVFHQKSLTIQ